MSEDNPIKAILLGEAGVGKTNLFQLINGGEFENNYNYTLTALFCQRAICVNNKDYLFNLWDVPGQEQYRSLNRLYINKCQLILFIFEINKKKSFNEVDFWYNLVKEVLGEDGYIIALVGNKADLYKQQEVSDEEIEKKAKELNVKLKITSAKNDGEGFKKFFNELLEEYINTVHSNKIKASAYKIKEKEKKNSKNKNKCNN